VKKKQRRSNEKDLWKKWIFVARSGVSNFVGAATKKRPHSVRISYQGGNFPRYFITFTNIEDHKLFTKVV
jgi:hypothetical protein